MPGGLIGGLAQLWNVKQSNKMMDTMLKQDPVYSENPISGQRLSLARTLLNARMPGAAGIERNIYTAGANTMANAEKYSTDSSQLFSRAANIQGQQNAAFTNLGLEESQDWQRRYGNVVGAEEGVINEQDKVFNDKIRRFGNLFQVRGQQQQNKTNLLNSSLNEMDAAANLGLNFLMPGAGSFLGGGQGGKQGSDNSNPIRINQGWSPGWTPKNRYDYFNP